MGGFCRFWGLAGAVCLAACESPLPDDHGGAASGSPSVECAESRCESEALWWNEAWSHRKSIRLHPTGLDSTLTAYPIAIAIDNDADLAYRAQASGADLVFVADGRALAYEIETWQADAGKLLAWVSVPEMHPEEERTVELYYGNPAATSGERVGEVWDSGFAAVWHMSDDFGATEIVHNSAGDLDGVAYALDGDSAVDGALGQGVMFDGDSEYIEFDPEPGSMPGALTVECWFKANLVGNSQLVSRMGSAGERGWDISFDDDPTLVPGGWLMGRTSSDGELVTGVGYEEVSPWRLRHAALVFTPGERQLLYVDGAVVDQVDDVGTELFDNGMRVILGRSPAGGQQYTGVLDEVRISTVARSSAYLAMNARTILTPLAAYSVGPEETLP